MKKEVTIIYYDNSSLELKHVLEAFDHEPDQTRIVIPNHFKKNKTIIAVCDGNIDILNKLGDRILPSAELEISVTDPKSEHFHLNIG